MIKGKIRAYLKERLKKFLNLTKKKSIFNFLKEILNSQAHTNNKMKMITKKPKFKRKLKKLWERNQNKNLKMVLKSIYLKTHQTKKKLIYFSIWNLFQLSKINAKKFKSIKLIMKKKILLIQHQLLIIKQKLLCSAPNLKNLSKM